MMRFGGVDKAGDPDPGLGVVAGEQLGGDDGVGDLGEVDAVPVDEPGVDVAQLHLPRHAHLEVVVVVWRAAVPAARHQGLLNPVACVVGDEVVLDGEQVGEDDGGVGHAVPEQAAGLGELPVEGLGDGVVGGEAAVGVEVAVVVPRDGQLLRQAAQRPRPVDPELPRAVRVQSLNRELDGSNYRWDLGEHLVVGKVEIGRQVIVPNVYGVDGVPESFMVNRGPLACIASHTNQSDQSFCNTCVLFIFSCLGDSLSTLYCIGWGVD